MRQRPKQARSQETLSRILDAACGSGLTGTALRDLGYENIEGIDISAGLLALSFGLRHAVDADHIA